MIPSSSPSCLEFGGHLDRCSTTSESPCSFPPFFFQRVEFVEVFFGAFSKRQLFVLCLVAISSKHPTPVANLQVQVLGIKQFLLEFFVAQGKSHLEPILLAELECFVQLLRLLVSHNRRVLFFYQAEELVPCIGQGESIDQESKQCAEVGFELCLSRDATPSPNMSILLIPCAIWVTFCFIPALDCFFRRVVFATVLARYISLICYLF